jgi:uncharacterized protein DUF6983
MSWYIIPFNPQDVHVTQEVSLEGTAYKLGFWYNQREGCYYLSIGDPNVTDGSWLVSSIKVVTNKGLLRRWSGAAENSAIQMGNVPIWPPGELFPFALPDDSIATLGDLGARVTLYYVTSDDPFWNF